MVEATVARWRTARKSRSWKVRQPASNTAPRKPEPLGDKTGIRERLELAATAAILVSSDYADGALKADRIWDRFERFVKEEKLTTLSPGTAVVMFAAKLIKEGLKVTTILSYLSLIRKAGERRQHDWMSRPRDERIYTRLRRNIQRILSTEDKAKGDKKHPLAPSELLSLAGEAEKLQLTDSLIVRHVMIILFGGLMRGEDLLQQGPFRPLLDDVEIVPSGREAILRLNRRKTSTTHGGAMREVLLINSFPGNPVQALRELKSIQEARKEESLIPAWLSMEQGSFPTILRALTRRAGLTSHITPHSFRHGAATFLYGLGVPTAIIKHWGGWSSTTSMEVYIRENAKSLLGQVRKLPILTELPVWDSTTSAPAD